MFFLIPINTDAPIYHWPLSTIGLIVLNFALFFLVPDVEPYALPYGEGLTPLQWVSSNFMHQGFLHLFGNMVFLWGYGIIIEGKLGPLQFLLLYVTLGTVQCAATQLMLLGSSGVESSMGASAIVYALLAISIVWAPKNELTVFLFIFLIRVIAKTFEVSILKFSGIYIAFELLTAVLFGFQAAETVMNLLGILVGTGAAFLFLNSKWVDCEGWDIINVSQNKHIKTISELLAAGGPVAAQPVIRSSSVNSSGKRSKKPNEGNADISRKIAKRREKIRQLLADEKPTTAAQEYTNAVNKFGPFSLDVADVQRLADGFYKKKMYEQAAEFYEQLIERQPQPKASTLLHLAAIYVENQRPRAALRLIESIPEFGSQAQIDKARHKIERAANRLIEDGVLEMQIKP